ncbi:EAL domain-containing protein [Gammaproteobacteria bacterium]|nr:EAL domain-containing protein [Gammaproteobacteria bacterium]
MFQRWGALIAGVFIVCSGAYASPSELRLIVARTAAETGVMNKIIDEFQKDYPEFSVKLTAAGGLDALNRARSGEADALITHYPQGEELFIADGIGVSRNTVMYNDCVLFGPPDDPLHLQGERDLIKVLQTLAENEVDFLVPHENSGTYQKLATLWKLADIVPDWVGYESSGASAAATLKTAATMGSYTFVDFGTFLAHRESVGESLVPLYRDHVALRNSYSYITINSETLPKTNQKAAAAFRKFLLSDGTQSMIEGFGREKYQTNIFTPGAHMDPSLRAEKAIIQLKQKQRSLQIAGGLAIILAVSLFISLFLFKRTRVLQRATFASQSRFSMAVAGSNDGIWDWDILKNEGYFSPRLNRILGITKNDDVVTDPFKVILERIHPDFRDTLVCSVQDYLRGDGRTFFGLELRTCACVDDNNQHWVMLRGKAIRDEKHQPIRMSGSITDITDAKLQQSAIEHQALHDALTQLPNRLLLLDRLEQTICNARRNGHEFALLIMDLDRFKEINDTVGHQIGDEILEQVAHRMQRVARETDTVARLGGDEFAILLPMAEVDRAKHFAEKTRLALRRAFDVRHHSFVVGASVGIAMYPNHGETAESLLRRADVAMYHAKRSNAGIIVYNVEDDPHSVRRLQLEKELREAIENDQITLYYQPKIDLRTKTVCGVEALLRWIHPEDGAISPEQIIELGEQTGLIKHLTGCVINTAMRQAAMWSSQGMIFPIAMNLSVWNVQDPDLPWLVEDQMRKWKILPDQLEFEITESAMMSDTIRAHIVLKRFNELGIKIAIDDFGVGFSSLSYLKRLPVQVLKIDKSFIQNICSDENDQSIVRSTIEMAHNLGLNVVAEGVETNESLSLLCELGCDVAQGYLFSQPLPPELFIKWLETSPWGQRPLVDRPNLSVVYGNARLH